MNKLYLLLMSLLPMLASAYDAEIDGICYNLNSKSKTAEVTSNSNSFWYSFYSGSIDIPESITHEGTTYSVTSIDFWAFQNCTGLTSITIPNSVTSIRSRAFQGCTSLVSITIPNSVTSIGESAFANCSGLNKVIVKDIAAWCNISFDNFGSNPLECAHHLYSDENTEITDLVIPNSVRTIGKYVFVGCNGLTSVSLPNSVTSIGYHAFGACHGLTSVSLPNSATSIEDFAFSGCSSLTSVIIPNSVTFIHQFAFNGCTSLTSITLGKAVNEIEYAAFQNCPKLTDVTCYARNVPKTYMDTNRETFNNTPIECATLHVPEASINEYKSSVPWNSFGNIVALKAEEMPSEESETSHRPMLVEGKEWGYTYHHIEDQENGDLKQSTYPVVYRLLGDTIIDGRQYMKLYRMNMKNPSELSYSGAYREDEEGRVYRYVPDEAKDLLLIDFSWKGYGWKNVVPIQETINVNNHLFRRYRYQNERSDGSSYMMGYVGVEGVGFKGYGLVNYLFEPEPDCICDSESFDYVSCGGADGYFFSNSEFDASSCIGLTDEEKDWVQSNNDFAFRLMREAQTDQSQLLSPLSITYALGMLNNGAAGQTQQEINDVLGFGEAGADGINQFCRKFLTEAPALDKETRIDIANTIFVNSGMGYKLKPAFVEKVNQWYDAEPESRDFNDGQTLGVINQWSSDHTEGMIKEIMKEEEFEPQKAVSYLLNALYFKGTWTTTFDPADTREESFNGGKTVQMMHLPHEKNSETYWFDRNDSYEAVELPYGNGSYTMSIYLPQEGKTISDVLEQLNGKNWQVRGLGKHMIDLKLPRFETSSNENLIPIMEALGMPTAFNPFAAEFPYLCNHPSVYIGLMKQAATIKVNEEGTEAAAVTAIGAIGFGGGPSYYNFHATRPFLYIISERSSGAIFFIGQYMGDGTTGISDLVRSDEKSEAGKDALFDLSGRRLEKKPSKGIYIEDGRKVLVK